MGCRTASEYASTMVRPTVPQFMNFAHPGFPWTFPKAHQNHFLRTFGSGTLGENAGTDGPLLDVYRAAPASAPFARLGNRAGHTPDCGPTDWGSQSALCIFVPVANVRCLPEPDAWEYLPGPPQPWHLHSLAASARWV